MATTTALLNSLIEMCHDGHRGYQAAAQQAGSMELKRLLGKFALERRMFAEELGRKIDRKTGTPHNHGTVAGALHRGYIGLMGNIRDLSPAEVLSECARGEEVCVRRFEEVLKSGLPEDTAQLVTAQLRHVAEARDRMRELAADASRDG